MHKTNNTLSAMAIDQCRERDNGAVKVSDGAIGLSENPAATRPRPGAGSEVARYVAAFEEDQLFGGPGTKRHVDGIHHEQQLGVYFVMLKYVQSLTAVTQDVGNPFMEERNDLNGSRHQRYHGISCCSRKESGNHLPGSI